MEVKEIVSQYIIESSKTIEIQFRFMTDSDSEIREDTFDIPLIENYGFNVFSESYDVFEEVNNGYSDEDLDDSKYDDDESIYDIQEDDLKSFITEFYLDNPDKIPMVGIF
jgi:hypothetical protein